MEQFIREFETICASLKEIRKKNHGCLWDYYVPYFIEMKDEKLIEAFSYIAFASSIDADVSKWLKSNKAEVERFFEWSKSFKFATN